MSKSRLHGFWDSEKLCLLRNDENVLLSMSDAFANSSEKSRLDSMIHGQGTRADTLGSQILEQRL